MKEINIAEILKNKPKGLNLYSPVYGKVQFEAVHKDKIYFYHDINEHSVKSNGKSFDDGEVVIFPSKEMRDWSKFAWKNGDILVNKDGNAHVIFEGFDDDTYETFNGNNYLWKNEGITMCFGEYEDELPTSDFSKANKEDAQKYIHQIEKRLGYKLNLETLEIEKPKKPVFEIGKLYVFDDEDEDGNVTVIGNLIDKDESEDTLTFGNQYEIETEKFVTDKAFDLRISVHEELREATENEVELFSKHYSILLEKEKEAMAQPAFKTFDKVLVRCGKGCQWVPAFFVRFRGEDFAWRFNALTLNGNVGDFASCIPYEGHENFAFTDYDFVDLPF